MPPDEKPLGIDDFIPVTGKNYIAPHLISIPTGTVYTLLHYSRAVLLIPQTPTTTGIVYIYPNAYPATDVSSIPVPSGNNVYLDARGDWYVRTSSSGPEKFLVIDAGAAGNAAAVAASFGLTPAASVAPANRGAFYTAQKNVTAAATAEVLPSQAIPTGFTGVIQAKPTNTGYIWVGTSKANAENHAVAKSLAAGIPLRLGVTNFNLAWIDADVSGEGVELITEV